jgi:endopeptidase Clp ATP-binding regulatory subunit (clpX)
MEINMTDNNQNINDDEYEKICFVCRRPESKTGKQVTMPGGITICPDCMQRTFDAIEHNSLNGGMDLNDVALNSLIFGNSNNSGGGTNSTKETSNTASNESSNTENNENTSSENTDVVNGGEDKEKEDKGPDRNGLNNIEGRLPNIRFVNLADLQGDFRGQKKLKKRKPGEKKDIGFDIKKIPAPHKIKAMLDEYVVGQEYAKKVISVGVYNHYKRVGADVADGVEIEKSNMLMIGPTGSGKTYLVKTLAKLLDVPLAIADATSLTEAGYIGDDIESVVSKLLATADNDVDRAETGIIFIDEIDKIAKKRNASTRDVSGESVQQGLLKLLEGSEVEVPVGANSKNAMVPLATINTKNILFICGGAFPDLEDIIKERLNEQASIGFIADLKDKYDDVNDIIRQVTIEDLKTYGMIPEFLGRMPIIFTLDGLTEEMLAKVLKEPKNAILKQYKKLLELDEVDLEFDDDAILAIAKKAIEKKTGARALRSIIEEYMLDIMYEIPKDDNIGKVTITKEYIEKTGGPRIEMRGADRPQIESKQAEE